MGLPGRFWVVGAEIEAGLGSLGGQLQLVGQGRDLAVRGAGGGCKVGLQPGGTPRMEIQRGWEVGLNKSRSEGRDWGQG